MDTSRSTRDLLQAGLFIDGAWRRQGSDGVMGHTNPTTGRVQAEFPLAGAPEVDEAVGAARKALPGWRALDLTRRKRFLNALGEAIRCDSEALVAINALETGTPVSTGRLLYQGESYFEYYAGWLDKAAGESFVHPDGTVAMTYLEPVGVVGILVTWNSPIGMLMMSVAAALAAGCTVVLKAPEQAPFAVMRFGRICESVGLPVGVVNILSGGKATGEALVKHAQLDKISFTGGLPTARNIQIAAAQSLTPLLFELGGKSPNIVFPDVDVENVCVASMRITRMSGQGCSFPSRLLVHEQIHDQVVEGITARFDALKIGDPFDEATDMGPVISAAARDRILGMVDEAVASGSATLQTGGVRLCGVLADGFFLEPTLLTDVDNASPIAQDEVFGPVLTVSTFRDEDEAVALANDSRFGLAAYVHTNDLGRARRMASRLEAGTVAFNGAVAPSSAALPFGGIKLSGHGRQGGWAGLEEFLYRKSVVIPGG